MLRCIRCNRSMAVPCMVAANDNHAPGTLVVACDHALSQKSFVRRLALALKASKLSRRKTLDWMADVIFLQHDTLIIWPDGRIFDVSDTDIDDLFGVDGRWLSEFIKLADTDLKQRPQKRVLARLRLLDLAFKIARPETAWHFGR